MSSFAPVTLKSNLGERSFLLRFFLVTSETGLKACSNLDFKLG
jgi:hypothetical protein